MGDATQQPLVFIIVLNWNGLKDTAACLESLSRLDYDNYHVVVVDNGSSDGSARQLRAMFSGLEIFTSAHNRGFTGGNNFGMGHALRCGAEYVWLLNNDTVVEPCTLKTLVTQGESAPDIGMLSPVICYFDDSQRVQFRGSVVDWSTLDVSYPASDQLFDELRGETADNVCLWGTALLIKRRLVERIGPLPERYFAYWEDTEYSLRSLKAGYRNVVVSTARVLHKVPLPGTVRFQRKPHYFFYMTRNRQFLTLSYLGGPSLAQCLKMQLLYAVRKYRHHSRSGEPLVAEAYLDGMWNALLRHGGSWEERLRSPGLLKRTLSARLLDRLLDD